jgi:hypothetical protein
MVETATAPESPAAAKPLVMATVQLVTATVRTLPASAAAPPAEMLTLPPPPRFWRLLAQRRAGRERDRAALPKVRRRRVVAAQHDRVARAHAAARLALPCLASPACRAARQNEAAVQLGRRSWAAAPTASTILPPAPLRARR